MRILIADDEVEIARALKHVLEKNKFSVDLVHSGTEALTYALHNPYDVVVLDIMMPGMDGLTVLSELRRQKKTVPVMLLTARAEIDDRVEGLEAGADDYLPKPFAIREFLARVRALSRRNASYVAEHLSLGNVRLNRNSYELVCGTRTERLNNKEYQLMELFLQNPRHVFSTQHLMDRIWGCDAQAELDVVWTYIGFLRKKLKSLGADIELRTIRGAGYALEERKGEELSC